MYQMSTTTNNITVNNTHRTVVNNNVSMQGAHVLTHTHIHGRNKEVIIFIPNSSFKNRRLGAFW